MADYKIPTPTQKPVPSADIRDVVFAGAKVDEWAASPGYTYTDRFGKQHLTAEGINNQFQQFLHNSGYEFLADYTDGPITFTRRNQITAYNGEFYRPNASVSLPYTTTGNTATTWETDKSNFVAVGDAALRQELASSSGFGYIGQVDSIAALRELDPKNDGSEYLLRGHASGSTIGHGTFYYDASDTTTVDNDCTVVVTTSGARLKRKGVTDKIFMEWAGVLTVDQTDDYQDDALDNCIKAAAVGSASGYCCRQIIGPLFGRVRLKSKHYIRGGVYALAFGSGVLSNPVDGATGVTGRFVMEKGAGFYVAQTIGAVVDLHIDNYGVVEDANQPDLGVTSGVDYVLRCEAYNQGIDIDIEAQGYAGNILYSLGKGATSENAAHWSDLIDDYQGLNNLTNGRYNVRNCGRTFNVSNSLSGVGQMGSVWEQWNSGSSLFNGVADVSLSTTKQLFRTTPLQKLDL